MFGELLIRASITELYRIQYSALKFGRSIYNKPFIIGHESIHFNLSHSGKWVVCALGECRVGVDVEQVNAIDAESVSSCFSR